MLSNNNMIAQACSWHNISRLGRDQQLIVVAILQRQAVQRHVPNAGAIREEQQGNGRCWSLPPRARIVRGAGVSSRIRNRGEKHDQEKPSSRRWATGEGGGQHPSPVSPRLATPLSLGKSRDLGDPQDFPMAPMAPKRRTAAAAGLMIALATLPAAHSFAPSPFASHLRPARAFAVDCSRGSRGASLGGVLGAAMDVSSGGDDMAKSMRDQREGALNEMRQVCPAPLLTCPEASLATIEWTPSAGRPCDPHEIPAAAFFAPTPATNDADGWFGVPHGPLLWCGCVRSVQTMDASRTLLEGDVCRG